MIRIRGVTAVSAIIATIVLGAMPPASAQGASPDPPGPGGAGRATPHVGAGASIKAVVVKSWGACGSGSLVWDDLNANWSSYGSTPIFIDYSDPDVCGDSFTLAGLEANGADVVILDNPAGGVHQFTPDEVAALQTYASEGHGLIGTFLTFAYGGVDNSALAPLFGLQQGAGWTGAFNITPTYNLRVRKNGSQRAKPLFRHIPNPYVSTGYAQSQGPGDLVWSINELAGGRIVAKTGDKLAAIIRYQAGTYVAVYVANMPEYGGGAQDKQFIYNAIVHP